MAKFPLQSGPEYVMKEREQLGVSPHNFTWSPYAQYCFDATLTLAYALNQTITGTCICKKLRDRFASVYIALNIRTAHIQYITNIDIKIVLCCTDRNQYSLLNNL